jgi:tRNA A37 threonylcarbamoyladenosine dehydratase
MDRFERCKMLFGQEDFDKIQKAKIIILGVGGVGGHALDCLYRTGIKDITIVDFDSYDITNQNRQLGSDEIDIIKVEKLCQIYPGVKGINTKIDLQWLENNPLDKYDLILDAIDDIRPKVAIIKKYHKKLISSGGSAKRIDPTKIEYINIWKTHSDPFVRKIRENLKKEGFRKNFKIIFSSENPKCTSKGSFVGVTGSFGLTMCSLTINKILSQV